MKEKSVVNHVNLVLGLFLIFFGGGLLLWNVGKIPFIPAVVSILSVCLGIILLYFVYYLDINEFYLFLGMFLIQGAILWIIDEKLLKVDLANVWPVFLLITGLTLLPYSLRKKRRRKSIFLVPSITFIVLALFFLPFSLELYALSLGDFIGIWWPVFLLVPGVILFVVHFRKSLKVKREETDSR